jgi:Zn-dependent protease
MFDFDALDILLMLPAVLAGFTVHEYSHALTAVKLGDDTPKLQGRLTLNPISHIDIMGLVLILIAGFGWAKPVQINPKNFKNPRNDEVLVSIAGPFANILFAILIAVVLKILITSALDFLSANPFGIVLYQLLTSMIWISCLLSIFNMFPIPPLDGSHILLCYIPDRYARFKMTYQRYGRFILIALILFGGFSGVSLLPLGYLTESLYGGILSVLNI